MPLYAEKLGEGIATTATRRWGEWGTGKLSDHPRSNKWEVWTPSGNPTFQPPSPSQLSSPLHLWSLNHTASHPIKGRILCADTCSFQETLSQRCRCAEGEKGVWGHADFSVLNSHFMKPLFHLSRHSVKCSGAFLTAFHFTWSQKMLFSTLIHGVATHLITSAAKLTQSVAVEPGVYVCVLCSLFLSPHSSFSPVQYNPSYFLLRERMKLQPSHSGVGESTGTHTLKKIKGRRKETERDHMFMY